MASGGSAGSSHQTFPQHAPYRAQTVQLLVLSHLSTPRSLIIVAPACQGSGALDHYLLSHLINALLFLNETWYQGSTIVLLKNFN